jgi:hypothetical protein
MELGFDIRAVDSELVKNDSTAVKISEQRADSIMKVDPYYSKVFSKPYNLWIISKDKVYGPLDFSEYVETRKKLGVPEGLYLKI